MATSISWPELLELEEPLEDELELLELDELLDVELELEELLEEELLEEELELEELLPAGGVSAGSVCPPQLAMAETKHSSRARADGVQ